MNQHSLLNPEIEARITALLSEMTLREKAGQLNQVRPSFAGDGDIAALVENPDSEMHKEVQQDFHEEWIREGAVGSYLGVEGAAETNRLQKIAVEESRLGIPLLFGLDVIHGYRTIFPIPLAEACTWEPDVARRSAEIAAREAAAAGVHWTFAPMVDIARDPRWGRIAEGAGEDPYLGSAFAAARVQGFQGDDPHDPDHLAACAKHYVAYGGALAGREYNTVDLSLQTLHEIYLPPFKAAVDAGVATLMSAFNDINGVPASANCYTLTEVLRRQMGFSGFVVSDYTSIGELVAHGFAADRKEAGQKALLAGVDMDMISQSYRYDIPELVEAGALPIEAVDEAVRRVLRVKFWLGLFENPYRTTPEKEAASRLLPEHLAAARDAARRSMVLLKNEGGLLPLGRGTKKIAVVGPLAMNAPAMLGSWSFTGSPRDVITILDGIRAAAQPLEIEVDYAPGGSVTGEETEDFLPAAQLAAGADVVVAVVGETAEMSGEAASRMELGLPGRQEDLLKALYAAGKPLVVVLVNGRPLALPWVAQHAAAIIEAWQPGVQAGNALADVLFGAYNPAGRLAATFPYAVGQVPLVYNHPSTGRPPAANKFTSKYIDGPVEPLYPFGYGLSYTTFVYSGLTISPAQAPLDGKLYACATVTNTGALAGEEVVQLYIRDLVASRVRPVRELKGFYKVALAPGESRRVCFELDAQELGFVNEQMSRAVEPGKFQLWIGPDSTKGLEGEFELI
jgi:beta-glucosidase